MRRSLLLVDSPNLMRSVREFYGAEARPDYPCLIRLAEAFGFLVRAEAIVNDGLPKHFAVKFDQAGYRVIYSHADDCDDCLVARAVAAQGLADTIIVATGDHMIAGAAKLLQASGHKIVVAAVPQSVSDDLIETADAFLEVPICRGSKSSCGPSALRQIQTLKSYRDVRQGA